MQTLAYIKSHRLWVVRDLLVWGLAGDTRLPYLAVENVSGQRRLMFGLATIGQTIQDVRFENLIDCKGNPLPASINSPRVLIRPTSPETAYLVGHESDTGFRVARDPRAAEAVNVDLFIFEMGE